MGSRQLHGLTAEERGFLSEYVVGGKNTVEADLSDGVAGGLEAEGIIYRSSDVFRQSEAPYNLQPWARDYLSKNHYLLEEAKGRPPTNMEKYRDTLKRSNR